MSGSATRRTVTSMVRLTLGWAVGLVGAVVFWSLTEGRIDMPAWQLAFLPAALLGWLTVVAVSGWSRPAIVLLAVGSTASAVTGEYVRFADDYARSIDAARLKRLRADPDRVILDAVRAHRVPDKRSSVSVESNAEQDRREGPVTEAPERAVSSAVRRRLVAEAYFDRLNRDWWRLGISLALSWFAAFQAAKMTLGRRIRIGAT